MSELAISQSSQTTDNPRAKELAIAVLDQVINVHGDPQVEGQNMPMAYASVFCRAGETFDPITVQWNGAEITIQAQMIDGSSSTSTQAHLLILQTSEDTIDIVIGHDGNAHEKLFKHWTPVGTIRLNSDQTNLGFFTNPQLSDRNLGEAKLSPGENGQILIGTTMNIQNSRIDALNFTHESAYGS